MQDPPPSAALKPGDTIGAWRVERRLWQGFTGTVYLCSEGATKGTIKVFDSKLDDGWARFQREANLLAQLEHPRLVRCVRASLDSEPPQMLLEGCEGQTLRQRLFTGALPPDHVARLAADLADGVAFLHGQPAWHRDLRPSGIVLTTTGARIGELGAAKQAGVDNLTAPGARFGDVTYAPPEWMIPDQVQPALWDLYAVGTILHEALVGRSPFSTLIQDPLARMLLLTREKRALPHLDPGAGFAEPLRDLIRKLTANDPSLRLQSAREAKHLAARIVADKSWRAPAATPVKSTPSTPTAPAEPQPLPTPDAAAPPADSAPPWSATVAEWQALPESAVVAAVTSPGMRAIDTEWQVILDSVSGTGPPLELEEVRRQVQALVDRSPGPAPVASPPPAETPEPVPEKDAPPAASDSRRLLILAAAAIAALGVVGTGTLVLALALFWFYGG